MFGSAQPFNLQLRSLQQPQESCSLNLLQFISLHYPFNYAGNVVIWATANTLAAEIRPILNSKSSYSHNFHNCFQQLARLTIVRSFILSFISLMIYMRQQSHASYITKWPDRVNRFRFWLLLAFLFNMIAEMSNLFSCQSSCTECRPSFNTTWKTFAHMRKWKLWTHGSFINFLFIIVSEVMLPQFLRTQ